MHNTSIDTSSLLWQLTYDIFPEAAQLMGIAGMDSTTYDGYVGEYDYGDGVILAVTREGERLFAHVPGQPKFEIFRKSETEFFWKITNAQIEFVKDNEGKVTKAILTQGGKKLEGPKIK